jgi:hypothetical protein
MLCQLLNGRLVLTHIGLTLPSEIWFGLSIAASWRLRMYCSLSQLERSDPVKETGRNHLVSFRGHVALASF